MNKAKDILDRLNSLDEDKRVEAKSGSKIDRSLMETICSFSNEPGMGGGDIILGVECSDIPNDNAVKTYNVIGVEDTDKLQSDIATQCSCMFNIAVRPDVSIEKLNGKNVIVELSSSWICVQSLSSSRTKDCLEEPIGESDQQTKDAQKMICHCFMHQVRVMTAWSSQTLQWMMWMRMQ